MLLPKKLMPRFLFISGMVKECFLADWDSKMDQAEASQKLDVIRSDLLLVRRWKQNLWKSLVTYLDLEYGQGWKSLMSRDPELE